MAEGKKERPDFAVDYVKGDWDKVTYTDSPHIDNLMDCIVGLGAEVWALKRRNMVLEKILEEKMPGVEAQVEAYVPSEDLKTAWGKERDDWIGRVFTVLARVPQDTSGPNPTAKVPPINRS
jgi:hypothetical protein